MDALPAPPLRKIIHIDMDAFYASVEQRDDPALRGKPLAVGYAGPRGVVAAASYEARRFGVRSAMASSTARRKCPELIFVPPRFDAYRAVSRQIHAIFADFTSLIEPLSLDEAYLDVTGADSATDVATRIRARIRAETGLTASAGVSYNKFLAKIASDQNKPDGLCVVTPRQGAAFAAALPVARFHGVGPKTAARMAQLGIHDGAQLRDYDLTALHQHFGKAAAYYHAAAHGHDDRPVRPDREHKSISAERTFDVDLIRPADLIAALEPIADAAWARVERSGLHGRTVTLKVKYADFSIMTRSRSFAAPVADLRSFSDTGAALMNALCPVPRGVRLLGLGLSAFHHPAQDGARQLGLALPPVTERT